MQNECMNVNSASRLTAEECEILLRAEIELADKSMDEGLQLFAAGRDRKMAAVRQLEDMMRGGVV